MATMLSVLVTDAKVSAPCLQIALKHAVDRSFNAVSIDGDTSTNDTLAVLANGLAPGWTNQDVISDPSSADFKTFQSALTATASHLSQLLVRDGEGATKFITIEVRGARSFQEGKIVASSIAKSPLVKTAMYGQDANWGRILCAVGYAGVPIDPQKVNLWFVDDSHEDEDLGITKPTTTGTEKTNKRDLHLVKDGRPHDVDEQWASQLLKRNNIFIRVDLGLGTHQASYWTCDFSLDYIKINADYRS